MWRALLPRRAKTENNTNVHQQMNEQPIVVYSQDRILLSNENKLLRLCNKRDESHKLHKRLYTIYFHLQEILEQAELIYGDRNQISVVPGKGGGRETGELIAVGHQGTSWDNKNVLYLIGEFIQVNAFFKTQSTVHLKFPRSLYETFP